MAVFVTRMVQPVNANKPLELVPMTVGANGSVYYATLRDGEILADLAYSGDSVNVINGSIVSTDSPAKSYSGAELVGTFREKNIYRIVGQAKFSFSTGGSGGSN